MVATLCQCLFAIAKVQLHLQGLPRAGHYGDFAGYKRLVQGVPLEGRKCGYR